MPRAAAGIMAEGGRLSALEAMVTRLAQENAELRDTAAMATATAAGAAAAAAQASAAGVPAMPTDAKPKTGVDTRMLGRPDRFNGQEDLWRGWSVVMRAYAGAISERLLFLIEESEAAGYEPSLGSMADEDDRGLCTQWYFVLAMLLQGRSAENMALVPSGEGLMLWRRLVQ